MRIKPTADQLRTAAREQFAGLLAVHPDYAERCVEGQAPLAGYCDDEEDAPPYVRRNGVGIVAIRGALSQRGGWWWDGHESIRARIERAFADPQVSCVALEINSPGGVVAGCFDAVDAVVAVKNAMGKPVLAYAREHAYSAALAWAMVSDEFYLPESGGTGSCGVLMVLFDVTKAYDDMGIKALVIRSDERKARGMPIEGWDDETVAKEQERVDKLADLFRELVARNGGPSVAALRALKGECLDGSAAVSAKLADGVLSWDAFLARAEQAGKKWKMKGIARALGLREDATEAKIEEEAAAVKVRADKTGEIATKGGEAACAYALVTGRMTAGERDAQMALIKAAPVEGIAALMSRAEGNAIPQPSVERRADAGQGQPPAIAGAEHEFSAWSKMGDAELGRAYGALIASDANGPMRLASVDPKLYQRASAAWRTSAR